jgi:hypothetical protein
MKKLITSFFFSLLTASIAHSGTSMKFEGSCSGTLSNNAPINFKYYSDFDGCKEKSTAAISFTSEEGEERGLVTGKRSFQGDKDIYAFGATRVVFENSTGNTSGDMIYLNEETGESEEVVVQCMVRDYHYAEEC